MSLRHVSVFLATSSTVLAISWAARADNPAAAEALFDTAKQLVAQDRYAEACPKFEESDRLDPGIGTKFHLADCWQHLGRTASAWLLFRDVETEAHATGQGNRERVARDRATALEPFVSKLVIEPRDAASLAQVEVRRDGVEVERDKWNAAVPVDPGAHIVSVSAPGKQAWQVTVDVPPQGKLVTLEVPPLVDLQPIAAAPTPAAAAPERPPPPPPPPPRAGVTEPMPPPVPTETHFENRGGAQRAVGWFFVAAGVAGLATAGYYTAVWVDNHNKALLHCAGSFCDPIGAQARSDAHTQEIVAIASAGAGAGAMLLGSLLVTTAPIPRLVVRTASLQVEPVIIPRGPSGLAVLGTW